MSLVQFLWLIPALPLLAAAIGAIVPHRSRKIASGAALAAMAGAFVLSVFALREALAAPGTHSTFNFAWLNTGEFKLHLGFLLDPLSAFMLVMVTFVSFLIFLFSTAYMREDENYEKFFCYLSLFASAMLGIVVSNSLLLTFISWELVGLASYLLIGFWFHKPEAAAAAKKAFITTRIGDIGFLLGLVWVHHATQTQLFYNGGAGFLEIAAIGKLSVLLPCGLFVSSAIGLLLFAGAVGKSGQFPLHVWLPDAMEGPTPVSALIHAATMVAAGVFLMARIYPMLALEGILPPGTIFPGSEIIQNPNGTTSITLITNALPKNEILTDGPISIFLPHHVSGVLPFTALSVVAFIGAITALIGAVVAVAQNDIKRVLAFSTVSQLGYMMLAIGVGAPGAAMFHLLTHAFFKALLFLGAGSVIHAAHHEQDMRQMGGLGPRMKITFATFAIGMMALSGVPFLFSGFWSKEAILHGAHGWHVSHLPFYIALVAVVLTAFYMTRLMANVFFGGARSHAAEHAHENTWTITLPLVLLAACAVLVGFLGTPAWPWLQAQLQGDTTTPFAFGKIFEGVGLLGLSVFLVAVGIGAGWAVYGVRKRGTATAPDPLEKRFPTVWRALEHRLYFDEFYAATVFKLNAALAVFADVFDSCVVDGVVRFVCKLSEFLGFINKDVDEHGLNAGFNATAEKLRGAGGAYSASQTGDARSYLRALALGFVVVTIVVLAVVLADGTLSRWLPF
ncbi:MAG: NAD(P)H-quinone oxidoreductase subunit F [Puniceicoccales bacterium]|jgi:NADH-quinone oxidoreductase subunit L|nr:NAD(P)H-quinone oxidoreductase subunit F [Puniceicoccales bacterium]